MQERDRQLGALRAQENALHQMELNERDMALKLREMTKLEEQIVAYKKQITTFTGRLKVNRSLTLNRVDVDLVFIQDVESKFAEAQAPIGALEQEFKVLESELNARITQVQNSSQELNIVVDKLSQVNKGVERYPY